MRNKLYLLLIPVIAILLFIVAAEVQPSFFAGENNQPKSAEEPQKIGFVDVEKVYGATSSYKIFKEESISYAKRMNTELALALKMEKDEAKRHKLRQEAQKRIKLYRETLLQDVLRDVDKAISEVADKQQLRRVYLYGAESIEAEDVTGEVIKELKHDTEYRLAGHIVQKLRKLTAEKSPETAADDKSTDKSGTELKQTKAEEKKPVAATETKHKPQPETVKVTEKTENKQEPSVKTAEQPKPADKAVQSVKAKEAAKPVVTPAETEQKPQPETVKVTEKTENRQEPSVKTAEQPKPADKAVQPEKKAVVIQFSASVNQKGILAVIAKAKAAGVPAYLQKGPLKNGSQWWRARAAAQSRQQADEYVRRLKQLGYSPFITGK